MANKSPRCADCLGLANCFYITISVCGVLFNLSARGAELYSGDGFDVRWDNTIQYSTAFRIAPRSGRLLANLNGDDGDRDFKPGLVSNRLAVLSDLDLGREDYGVHASAEGWYDTVYHMRTDNRLGTTYNGTAINADTFTPAVRDLYGQYAELRDAFIYGSFSAADIPVSVRFGRQTLLWGESLFYDANSIASAQAPTDYTRMQGLRSAYSDNVYLPVSQASATIQPLPNIAVSFYGQFEWRAAREAGDGSFLSYTDPIGPGAGRLFLGPGLFLTRQKSRTSPANGQWGAAVHLTLGDVNFGLYALRYNAKDPEIWIAADDDAPKLGYAGHYWLVYPSGVVLYGFSFSSYLDDSTVAGEISVRQNTPITRLVPPSGDPISLPTNDYAGYVNGDTLHAQLSATTTFGRSAIWNSADLRMETSVDQIIDTSGGSVPGKERASAKIRFLFEPHYFQVLPNLDVTLPVSLGYNLFGQGFGYYAQNGGAGDFEIGLSATYRSLWKATVSVIDFIGSPYQQPLADRRFVSASIERSF